MANLFEKAKTSKSPLASKRRADKISEQSEPQLEPRVEVKRAKLSASLQDDHGNISQPFTTPRKNPNSTRPTKKNPDPSQKKTDLPGVNIPVKTFTPTQRETRSMHRRPPEPIVCDDENDNDEQPETTPDVNLRKWEKPLVYPRFGKKMAEVDAQDRERLRDNEFLNDNLIGFYIRFLEEHLSRSNKEVAKRVYFFNSYFYATITNNSKGKGINYGGVQKWTRNVNLFNYDYIVVPINEAAHWYVAIICNLPQLQDQPENPTADQESEVQEKADQESEVHGIAETPEPSNSTDQVPKEETARQSLASMSLDDPGSQERDEWPEGEGPITSPARFSQVTTDKAGDKADDKADQKTDSKKQTPAKGKKKKPVPPPQKYDTRQPTIITFDSLDLGRSSTVSILRQYLYEEAKSKQGIEINTKSIKGMRARQVPKQDNFSDCGLYLLAYVEKFVQNPDEFATKLLRREMDEKEDWPELLPGYLRRRLRSFLDELYDEQAEITREKAAERTSMADREPISYLLGSSDLKQSDSPEQEQVEENRPESEQQTGEQLEEQAKEQLESKEGNEIIEVPDSQERGPDTVREEKPGQKDAVPVESDNGENGGGDGDSIIEVQVSGTPTNSEKEKQATSPRAKKE